jgi:hypothetical protein
MMAKTRTYNPYWLVQGAFVPNALLRLPDLSAEAKLYYGKINDYASNGPEPGRMPEKDKVVADMGISEERLVEIFDELVAYGLVQFDEGRITLVDDHECFQVAYGEVEINNAAS